MHGPRLRATPRRVALFALVAIAATDQLDDLSALVKAQGRLLEQMQQQIQSLELAVLQGRAQGADELISAPGRPGRAATWRAVQRGCLCCWPQLPSPRWAQKLPAMRPLPPARRPFPQPRWRQRQENLVARTASTTERKNGSEASEAL